MIGFFIIVFLASLFRVSFLGLIEFKQDEALNLFLATRYLFHHPFPPGATISSLGILNPPLFLYLLVPITLFTQNPEIISGIIGIVNALALGVLFLIYRKYYSQRIAYYAMILFSFAFWPVLYSRKIWAQDLVLPIIVFIVLCAHKIILEKEKIYWFVYTLCCCLLIQQYPSTVFFLVPFTIGILFQCKYFSFRNAFLGVVIGLVPLLPYLVFEMQHSFPNTHLLFTINNKLSYHHDALVFSRPFQIINKGDLFSVMGDDIATFAQMYAKVYHLQVIFYCEYLLLILGTILFWKKYPTLRVFVYATVSLPLLYFILKIDPAMHYFIILTPFLFLFLATGINSLTTHKKAYIARAGFILFSCISLYSLVFLFTFFRFTGSLTGLKGSYGEIYSQTEQETIKKFSHYRSDPLYGEMIIASHIPADYMLGNSLISHMLYSPVNTRNHLYLLENRLQQVPIDPLVLHELLAYYTTTAPTAQTVSLVREKLHRIPGYWEIYHTVYDVYLYNTLQKEYSSQSLGISFETPRHWIHIENTSLHTVSISGDGITITFIPSPLCQNYPLCATQLFLASHTFTTTNLQILNAQTQKVSCQTTLLQWCGSIYGPLAPDPSLQNISAIVTSQPGTENKEQDTQKTVIRILNSLRRS